MLEKEEWKSHRIGSVFLWSWEFSGWINRLPLSVLTIWYWENGLNKRQAFPCSLCWEGILKVLWVLDDARPILNFLCITMHTYQTCFAVAEWIHAYDSYLPLALCVLHQHLGLWQINLSLFLFCSSEKIEVITYYKNMSAD